MSIKATIFNVSRTSVSDGPGLRTVVYFKGCNLSCKWCHNPEGIDLKKEISFIPKKCINCGRCKQVCERGCFTDKGLDRTNCNGCFKCASVCPSKAIEVTGKEYTPLELYNEVIKDYHFFVRGGGVTLSGGECLLYSDFLVEFLKLLKEKGVHTLIESAFNVDEGSIEKVLPLTNKFYVDIKLMDSLKHKKYVGKGNELILKNVEKFASKSDITIRVPLIPLVNDDLKNLTETLLFCKKVGVKNVELLRFNPLGAEKYERFGKTADIFLDKEQSKEEMESLVKKLNSILGETSYVYFTI